MGQMKIMISGAPAAGKGTQCEKIVEKVKFEPCIQFLHPLCTPAGVHQQA